jgi:hypothetical protein
LGNGELARFLQPEYLLKTFALELIESGFTNYHELFRKVCLSSPLPTQDLYASSCPQITVMFTAFRALTLITAPPLLAPPQSALRALRFPARPLRHPCCLLAQVILLRARDGSRSHPHTTHQTHLSAFSGETDTGEPRPG